MSALPTASAVPAASRPITPAGAALRRAASLLIAHGILITGAVFILLPFVWMTITSIKSPAEIFAVDFSLWPKRFSGGENYGFALTRAPLLRFALNGLVVCAGILVVQVLVAVPCAYALAKLRFPGRTLLFALVLMGLCIPIQVPALPLYMGLARLGLLNTYFAIMMPFFLSVFAIFLFRQFFKGYPDEIIHAARLDGMGEFEIVWRIVVPSAWPAIAAFAVFSFIAHWNDLYWPLIVVSDTQSRHAAARDDVLCRRRDRLELRRADRGRHRAHRAAGDRVPGRPPPLHRRHHNDRDQVSAPLTDDVSFKPPPRRETMKSLRTLSRAVALAGAIAATGAGAQPVTLDVLYAFPAFAKFHEPIAQEFMKRNPDIKIEFRAPAPTYDDGHQTMLRQAVTNQLPDVYYSGFHLLAELARTLAKRNQIVDLDPLLAARVPSSVSATTRTGSSRWARSTASSTGCRSTRRRRSCTTTPSS